MGPTCRLACARRRRICRRPDPSDPARLLAGCAPLRLSAEHGRLRPGPLPSRGARNVSGRSPTTLASPGICLLPATFLFVSIFPRVPAIKTWRLVIGRRSLSRSRYRPSVRDDARTQRRATLGAQVNRRWMPAGRLRGLSLRGCRCIPLEWWTHSARALAAVTDSVTCSLARDARRAGWHRRRMA